MNIEREEWDKQIEEIAFLRKKVQELESDHGWTDQQAKEFLLSKDKELSQLRNKLEILNGFGVSVKNGVPYLEKGVCTLGDVNKAREDQKLIMQNIIIKLEKKLNNAIEIIRKMPNRDDKIKATILITDGGGINKFEVIELLEQITSKERMR